MVKRRFAGKVEVADDSSSQCGQRCCCDQDFLFHTIHLSCQFNFIRRSTRAFTMSTTRLTSANMAAVTISVDCVNG